MKSLADPAVQEELLSRLRRVRPDTPRRWGRMSAPQMVCHLSDSFKGVMGLRGIIPADHQRTSTQSSDRSTAFRHPRYASSRWSLLQRGSHTRSAFQ